MKKKRIGKSKLFSDVEELQQRLLQDKPKEGEYLYDYKLQ